MVLGAALIKQTENKCSTYFQGITVNISLHFQDKLNKILNSGISVQIRFGEEGNNYLISLCNYHIAHYLNITFFVI